MCEECPGAWLAPVQGCCHANSTSHRADVPVYFLLTLSFDHAVPAPYIAHERAKPESEPAHRIVAVWARELDALAEGPPTNVPTSRCLSSHRGQNRARKVLRPFALRHENENHRY